MSTSLIKTLLHKSISEGVYKEIVSRTARYFYFLGKTIAWEWPTSDNPPNPIDSVQYEKDCRNEIITVKEIAPGDVAYVVPRIDWVYNTVYSIYDDKYSTEVQGIDISNGGSDYLAPVVVISAPDDVVNGIQATCDAILDSGVIVGFTMTEKGLGYTSAPSVVITDATGVSASAVGVITRTSTGEQKLEDANFYVMTSEYSVYKCLYNNLNTQSTIMPSGNQYTPITTSDGYVWKYMFNVPVALRTKFLTVDHMPVITSLSQEFYSAGNVESVYIESSGTGYTFANISVVGDGHIESDPIYIESVSVQNAGTGYADSDLVTISQPMNYSANWVASTSLPHGVKVRAGDNIYEVSLAGITNTVSPTHKFGTVSNGTCTLTYRGTVAKAYPTFSGSTVTAINLLGGIRTITLTSNGSGYTTPPPVAFTPPIKTFSGTVSAVTVGTDIITLGPHWFSTGDAVVYSNGGGTSITPLVNNTLYYVIKSTSTSIKLASAYKAVTFTNAGDLITSNSHGYVDTNTVQFYNIASTTALGISSDILYFVVSAAANTFQISLTSGGAPIALTSDGTGNAIMPINLTVVGVGASHSISQNVNNTSAVATLSPGGVVQRITVTNAGENYVAAPTITVGTAWPANTAITLGAQYFVSSRLYTVTSAGTTHATVGPTGTVLGTQYTDGTAGLTYVGVAATASCTLKYGSGYVTPPSIIVGNGANTSFNSSIIQSKSEAKLIPILQNGQIIGVQIDDPGIGYSTATATVTGDGTGGSVVINTSSGNVDTVQANVELLAIPGTINNIQMISKGFDYGYASVAITGDGTGATAVATVNLGEVIDIVIVNQGQNYTFANVTITGNGKAASARAIIAPYGGHGKDSISELYTRTLMFYSNVSRDKNQGFTVNNDFRQLGIIKNIRSFGTTNRYTQLIGSTCFVIGGVVNTTNFVQDMLLHIPRVIDTVTYNRTYRLVCSTATGLLVQSLDGDTPLQTDLIYNDALQSVTVIDVTTPSVDKFSGDLLFIDNKNGFTPTSNEIINMRTVIKL